MYVIHTVSNFWFRVKRLCLGCLYGVYEEEQAYFLLDNRAVAFACFLIHHLHGRQER